jgi:dGTPase
MVRPQDLEGVQLWEESLAAVDAQHAGLGFPLRRYAAVRHLINRMVTDLATAVQERLRAGRIESVEAVRGCMPRLVDFGPAMQRLNRELKQALAERLYAHYRVTRMAMKAQKIISGLFDAYMSEPRQMPPEARRSPGGAESGARAVADYIAGLTDRSALDEYRKLYDPLERV